MASNPLEEDHERDHRVRLRAYHLWEADGRPHGREADYWERARELDAMESAGGTAQLPNPIATGADPMQDGPIEEAFLQENLGEFPDRFADQGEAQPVPHGTGHHKVKSEPVESRVPEATGNAKPAAGRPSTTGSKKRKPK